MPERTMLSQLRRLSPTTLKADLSAGLTADARDEVSTVKADQAKSGAALHPARVWPD